MIIHLDRMPGRGEIGGGGQPGAFSWPEKAQAGLFCAPAGSILGLFLKGGRRGIFPLFRGMMEKPEFRWESIEVGQVAGERDLTVTPEMVAAHLEGVGAERDWYRGDSPFGGPIAPPMIFINDVLQIIDENFRRFGTIHDAA